MQLQNLIESLLYEEESTELDFKRDQYPFDGADDRLKGELLKDILAFTNAWRRADAYILIGIQDIKGGRSVVEGVTTHLDDAKLQQFVNSKTSRPINFSYSALEFEGKQIALIRIPLQERPVFLLRDFGGLAKHQVYLRRGSSTAIALPDEIARMGVLIDEASSRSPQLSSNIVCGGGDERSATSLELRTEPLIPPANDTIPSFKFPGSNVADGLSIRSMIPANEEYYKQLAEYVRFHSALRPFRLSVSNAGTAVAMDVKLVIEAIDPERKFELVHQSDKPERPRKESLATIGMLSKISSPKPDVECAYSRDRWRIKVTLGKIQAKDTVVSSNVIFVGANSSGELKFDVKIFSDDLPAPAQGMLSLSFEASPRPLSVAELTNGRFES